MWSRSGRRIVTTSPRGGVGLWDVESGQSVKPTGRLKELLRYHGVRSVLDDGRLWLASVPSGLFNDPPSTTAVVDPDSLQFDRWWNDRRQISPDGRFWATSYRKQLTIGELRKGDNQGGTGAQRRVRLRSPVGLSGTASRWLTAFEVARLLPKPRVYFYEWETGKPRFSVRRYAPVPVFTPDGSGMAVWNDTGLWVYDLDRRRLAWRVVYPRAAPPGTDSAIANVAFSPDGRLLAVAHEATDQRLTDDAVGYQIGVYNVATGGVQSRVVGRFRKPTMLRWSRDGKVLLPTGDARDAYSAASGKKMQPPPPRIPSQAWSHDGRWLAKLTTLADPTLGAFSIELWRHGAQQASRVLGGRRAWIGQAAFDRTSSTFVVGVEKHVWRVGLGAAKQVPEFRLGKRDALHVDSDGRVGVRRYSTAPLVSPDATQQVVRSYLGGVHVDTLLLPHPERRANFHANGHYGWVTADVLFAAHSGLLQLLRLSDCRSATLQFFFEGKHLGWVFQDGDQTEVHDLDPRNLRHVNDDGEPSPKLAHGMLSAWLQAP